MEHDVVALCAGSGLIAAGVFLVSVAAGLVVLGVLVCALTILLREP
jgi:hypothetical protein